MQLSWLASMTRKKLTENEIRAFLDDGWYFRKKRSMGRDYITRRKAQAEKSLGPYEDDLWNIIVKLEKEKFPKVLEPTLKTDKDLDIKQTEKLDDYLNLAKDLSQHLSYERAAHLTLNCKYKGRDGFCSYWSWGVQPSFFILAKEVGHGNDFDKRKVAEDQGSESKWFVRAMPWFCKDCPVYVTRSDG